MTIKIVKQGEDLKAWRGNTTCTRCKAELEFDIEHVWATHCTGDMRDAYDYWKYGVNCPQCCLSNAIDESVLKLSEYAKFHIQSKFSRHSRGYSD